MPLAALYCVSAEPLFLVAVTSGGSKSSVVVCAGICLWKWNYCMSCGFAAHEYFKMVFLWGKKKCSLLYFSCPKKERNGKKNWEVLCVTLLFVLILSPLVLLKMLHLKKITRPIKTIAEILPLWSCSCRKSRALFMFYRYEKQVGRPDAFSWSSLCCSTCLLALPALWCLSSQCASLSAVPQRDTWGNYCCGLAGQSPSLVLWKCQMTNGK